MIEPVVLRRGNRPTHVVLTWEEWVRIREQLEDAEDAARADAILRDPNEDWVPIEVFDAIVERGVHPVRAWREHRGMTQADLATRAGLTQPTVARIEGGSRRGTVVQMKALATALGIKLDTLLDDLP